MISISVLRRALVGAVLAAIAFMALPATAQQSNAVTPSMLEQLTIADKLIAYGTERKDPDPHPGRRPASRQSRRWRRAGRSRNQHRGCA